MNPTTWRLTTMTYGDGTVQYRLEEFTDRSGEWTWRGGYDTKEQALKTKFDVEQSRLKNLVVSREVEFL